MSLLRQLLLIPLLAPLLAVMLVGALNPRPSLGLRLLTWTTPSLPIGIWLLIASGGGCLLSAAATGMALRQLPGSTPGRRQVRRSFRPDAPSWDAGAGMPEEVQPSWDAGPSRPPGEPPPTIAVPFRVIRAPGGRPHAEAATTEGAPGADDGWAAGSEEDW